VSSLTTEHFRHLLAAAPASIQSKAKAAYRLWAANPGHPSLRFKKVHDTLPIYAVRIDRDWRALGVLKDRGMLWFWIGPHSEYEKRLAKLRRA
jgi:hypothetical protein